MSLAHNVAKGLAAELLPRVVRRPIRVPTPLGFRFIVNPEDPLSLKMASGLHERQDVKLYRKLSLQPGTVVDVGANLGFFSLLFAKIYPQCRVEALEPNPYASERMRQNLAANSELRKRICLHECAAGDRNGTANLAFYPGPRGHAWARIGVQPKEGMTTLMVSLRRLDDLIRSGPVRLIKIDVEGHELEVLRGAERLLAMRPIIVFEVSLSFLIERPGVYQEELAIAARCGYRPFVAHSGRLVPYEWPAERVFNLWFLPE